MESENQGIKCKTFWDTEAVIRKVEPKIEEARSNKERRYYAQDILVEMESLLSCPNYNTGDPDCISCRSISRRYFEQYEYLAKDKRPRSVVKR